MPITEKQRKQRRKRLGGSDMAPVMGFDPSRNAYDIFLEKTGKLIDAPEPNQPMLAGTMFEDGVLAWAEGELDLGIKRNQYRSNPALHLGVHIDGVVQVVNRPVEVKTGGLYGPLHEKWGEVETDEVPDRVIIQAHAHLLCLKGEPDLCYVPTFLGGRGFGMYYIRRNKLLLEAVAEAAVEFWEKYVLRDIPPPDVWPSETVWKRIRRVPAKVTRLSQNAIERYRTAADALKQAENEKKAAQAALIGALGDAEAGNGDTSAVTYYEQDRKGYTVQASKTRVLRLRKGLIEND